MFVVVVVVVVVVAAAAAAAALPLLLHAAALLLVCVEYAHSGGLLPALVVVFGANLANWCSVLPQTSSQSEGK